MAILNLSPLHVYLIPAYLNIVFLALFALSWEFFGMPENSHIQSPCFSSKNCCFSSNMQAHLYDTRGRFLNGERSEPMGWIPRPSGWGECHYVRNIPLVSSETKRFLSMLGNAKAFPTKHRNEHDGLQGLCHPCHWSIDRWFLTYFVIIIHTVNCYKLFIVDILLIGKWAKSI